MFRKNNRTITDNPEFFSEGEPLYGEENSISVESGSDDAPADEKVPHPLDKNSILGKFKSVEDLSKAYLELQKKFGQLARETGELRKIAQEYEAHLARCKAGRKQLEEFKLLVDGMGSKYNTEAYLQNREFRELLKAAYDGYGNKLDVDSMVRLVENYLNSRMAQIQRADALKSESDKATDMLAYSNNQSKFKTKGKKLTDMTPEELDKALDELM